MCALAGGSLSRASELARRRRQEQARRDKGGEAPPDPVRDAAGLDPEDASTWIAYGAIHGEDRESARETCQLLEVWLRDVLATQAVGEAAPLALPDRAAETRAAAAALSPSGAAERIDLARCAAAALKQNASPALALERMLIGWFHGDR